MSAAISDNDTKGFPTIQPKTAKEATDKDFYSTTFLKVFGMFHPPK